MKGFSARMAQDDGNSVVRFPSSLLDGGPGGAGEARVADAVSKALAETLPGAVLQGRPTRDAATGRWEAVVTRPNPSGAPLGLAERDALTFTVGATRADATKAHVSLGVLATRFAPEAAAGGTPLQPPGPAEETVEDTGLLSQPALDRIRDRVGLALKGERLDDETGKWVPFR